MKTSSTEINLCRAEKTVQKSSLQKNPLRNNEPRATISVIRVFAHFTIVFLEPMLPQKGSTSLYGTVSTAN